MCFPKLKGPTLQGRFGVVRMVINSRFHGSTYHGFTYVHLHAQLPPPPPRPSSPYFVRMCLSFPGEYRKLLA